MPRDKDAYIGQQFNIGPGKGNQEPTNQSPPYAAGYPPSYPVDEYPYYYPRPAHPPKQPAYGPPPPPPLVWGDDGPYFGRRPQHQEAVNPKPWQQEKPPCKPSHPPYDQYPLHGSEYTYPPRKQQPYGGYPPQPGLFGYPPSDGAYAQQPAYGGGAYGAGAFGAYNHYRKHHGHGGDYGYGYGHGYSHHGKFKHHGGHQGKFRHYAHHYGKFNKHAGRGKLGAKAPVTVLET